MGREESGRRGHSQLGGKQQWWWEAAVVVGSRIESRQ